MGAALNMAGAMGGYVLADRGTWIGFIGKGELRTGVEGDSRLLNSYGVILVNPAKHPSVREELGQAFIDWLTGVEGQSTIRSYTIDRRQLFFPSAKQGQM
jgi:tungstate transport system substrate-binding protein